MFLDFLKITFTIILKNMYKVEISKNCKDISELNNEQLLCSYFYLKETYHYIYKKKLSTLAKKEKRAVIYDLTLFEQIKEQQYFLRCTSSQKWFDNWEVKKKLLQELGNRKLTNKISELN